MPTTLRLKSRRGIGSKFAGPLMKAEQRKEYEKLRRPIVGEFEKVVANWSSDTKPKFHAIIFTQNPKNTSMSIVVTGDEHSKKTWKMLDTAGRKSGKLIVRRNPRKYTKLRQYYNRSKGQMMTRKIIESDFNLHFRDYMPKTFGYANYGWPGERYGPWTSTIAVRQGAIKPRKFSEDIMNRVAKDEFRKAARRGYRRIFNKLTKGPKI